MQDHYETLGVNKDAKADEIKSAFRKLAKEHHPDIPGGNAAKFQQIQEAYEVLSFPAQHRIRSKENSASKHRIRKC